MKKIKSIPMSFTLAVFMLTVGILLGSIFTFGMQYWNKNIPKEECKVVKTQFLAYDEIWHAKPTVSIVEIAIDCTDGNRYFIDGVSINEELRNQLSSLSKNDDIKNAKKSWMDALDTLKYYLFLYLFLPWLRVLRRLWLNICISWVIFLTVVQVRTL